LILSKILQLSSTNRSIQFRWDVGQDFWDIFAIFWGEYYQFAGFAKSSQSTYFLIDKFGMMTL